MRRVRGRKASLKPLWMRFFSTVARLPAPFSAAISIRSFLRRIGSTPACSTRTAARPGREIAGLRKVELLEPKLGPAARPQPRPRCSTLQARRCDHGNSSPLIVTFVLVSES